MPVCNRATYRPDPFERNDIQVTHPDPQIILPTPQNMELDIQRNHLDNTTLLREISKKYILIPKLRSSLVNEHIATIPPQALSPIAVSLPLTNATSKEDWKSKYDILEQLKKKEKDDQADKYVNDEQFPVKEIQAVSLNKKNDIFNYGVVPYKDTDVYNPQERGDGYVLQSIDAKKLNTKYEHEVPEEDLVSGRAKTEAELQSSERSSICYSKTRELSTDKASMSVTPNISPETDRGSYILQNQHLEQYAPVENDPATSSSYPNENLIASECTNEVFTNNIQHQINEVPQQEGEGYPDQYEQPTEIEGKYPETNNVYLDPEDYSPIQVVEQLSIKPTANDSIDIKEEVTEYPTEMLNVEEFTPKDDVKLIDGINVNPKYMISKENTEPAYDVNPELEIETVHQSPAEQQETISGIDDFNAEQKEMFYSEETAQYSYNQQQGDAYNQDYVPPEQDYTSYESPAALQEQESPIEINEHEESTTRYDQAYEEQYAAYDQNQLEYTRQEQLENVQPEGYNQTGQQYEGYDQTEQHQYYPQEGYDQTEQQPYVQQEVYNPADQQYQDYEYLQHGEETAQNIQETFDTEQGFVDQYNYEQHIENQPKPEDKPGEKQEELKQVEAVAEPVKQAVNQTAS